jgi:ferredoxin
VKKPLGLDDSGSHRSHHSVMAKIIYNGKTYEAQAGRDLLSQLLDAGASIMYICMSGSCGTCRVDVCKGREHLGPMHEVEFHHFLEQDGSVRLACQAIVLGTGDVDIRQ